MGTLSMPPAAPPTRRPSVLIVSNGYGEDAVGAALAAALGSVADVSAYPLVGFGERYEASRLLEPRRAFPSGGFALRAGWRHLLADLHKGAFRHWQAQRHTLARHRGRLQAVIAVGDVYCLWMAGRTGTPIAFVATAKSVYNEPYRAIERALIRRMAQVVFVRDLETASALLAKGIPAQYVGNPLMDTIELTGQPLPPIGRGPTVTLLPGSRTDAYANAPLLLRLAARAGKDASIRWLCVVAPTLEIAPIQDAARRQGWAVREETLQLGSIEIGLTRAFGEALHAADVVVGLAGTANEQAAGLGKPVVAFPGPGSQFTARFLALQGRLLGDALVATAGWEDASEAVIRLLAHPDERERRGQLGRARMGLPGAIATIAREVQNWLDSTTLRG